MTKVLPSVTLLGSPGTMAERGTWDAVNSAFPGSGYFTGATLPPVAIVCSSGKTGGANGTATCQTGTPTGTDPAAAEILSGKSAWSSTGSVINGAMANRSGAWSLTSAWPGSGFYDTAPTFPGAKVCDDTNLFGALGTANCGAYRGNMMSTAHRKIGSSQSSLAFEVTTGLTDDANGYHLIPRVMEDDDGNHSSSPMNAHKQSHPAKGTPCGTTGTVEARIADCNVTWSGSVHGMNGESDWKLVTYDGSYEVWRDERTGLIWSDFLGYINWCQASGNTENAGGIDCRAGQGLQPATPVSWCTDAAIEAAKKGDLDSGENITWRLPTIYDWKQADVNGIRFVLPNMGAWFWSASVDSSSRSVAWQFDGGYGFVGDVINGGFRNLSSYAVRCVGAR